MEPEKNVVLRAWKDEQYRKQLPDAVRDALPNRPEGYEKLSDEQLEQVAGAASPALAIMAVAGVGWGAFAIEGAVHAVATDD